MDWWPQLRATRVPAAACCIPELRHACAPQRSAQDAVCCSRFGDRCPHPPPWSCGVCCNCSPCALSVFHAFHVFRAFCESNESPTFGDMRQLLPLCMLEWALQLRGWWLHPFSGLSRQVLSFWGNVCAKHSPIISVCGVLETCLHCFLPFNVASVWPVALRRRVCGEL